MNNSNGATLLVAVVAMALALFGVYTANTKRACECPRPQIHDDQDRWEPRDPRRPSRPRRPDGSTGEAGEEKKTAHIVNRDM